MPSRFNIKQLFEAAKRDGDEARLVRDISESLDNKEVKPSDFSIRGLFEDLVEDGRELLSDWHRNTDPTQRTSFMEAGVSSTSFSNITGQLLVNAVMESYNDPVFIADQLVTTMPTKLPKGEKIPGMSRIGNEAEAIGEGQPYPLVGFGEDWIETPETIKRGMIVPLTREAIVQDLTGLLLERARDVAYWIRYNKEIRCLQSVLGITSSYNRRSRGVVASYGDSSGNHDWDNLAASNALVDWTDVEAAELLFDGLTDPNVGTPIAVIPDTIVVPSALKHTAKRVLNATEIRHGDGASATYATTSPNPLSGGTYKLVTSQLVKTVTSSDSTWFLGAFKRGFKYMEVSPISVIQAPSNSHDEFHRDIMQQWKVSEWGVAAVTEPRVAVKCTA